MATSSELTTSKTKNFKVKHPKRKIYRASEPLLSVFMWGINHTVRELSHISIPVMLMPDDFRAFTKIKVDNFAFNKENLPSHYKVSIKLFSLFFISFSRILQLHEFFYLAKSFQISIAKSVQIFYDSF